MTAPSSASWSRFSPPSNCVNGHVSTMWFVVCRWPQSQEGDWVRPQKNDGVIARQWQQLDLICKQSAPRSRQITTPTPHHPVSTGRTLFLTPNQQCQSTEGKYTTMQCHFPVQLVETIRIISLLIHRATATAMHDVRFSATSLIISTVVIRHMLTLIS